MLYFPRWLSVSTTSSLLPAVIELVWQAGDLIAREAARPGGPRGAGDKADVDLEVEERLREGLLQLLPGDFVGEETGVQLSGASTCWVVDPNDGTSDFLRPGRGSGIAVGLLVEHEPVLGVIYAPLTAQGPDCIVWQQGASGLWRGGQASASSGAGSRCDDFCQCGGSESAGTQQRALCSRLLSSDDEHCLSPGMAAIRCPVRIGQSS
ncbi:inositol monophosphatase family protein [Pseudomonas knackmussii]|uniref:inositol monophosphatase family protein n=1 Tax=Pseudomonas knackmussii TaxID=65741 RepID=UPI003BBA6E60